MTTSSVPHLYLIGASGVGMVWIADYALGMGWKVSGTDLTETAQTKRLAKRGANFHYGPDVSQIPDDITECVITAAVNPSAPHYVELAWIERRGIPVRKRSEWTGRLTRQKHTIAVAGTHGKTTTTAMVGWILAEAGLDPTVFAGAAIPAWNGETRIGKSDYLVIEADEYDRSFHRFFARMAIILNIEPDHLDYYTGGIQEIIQSFRRFLRNLPSGVHASPKGQGIVIANGRDANIRKAARGFKLAFHWYDETNMWPGLTVPQPGAVYRLNALAAAKVAHELGVATKTIKEALSRFPGAERRFEYLGTWDKADLYDDYAHHPTEVTATLAAFRERYPAGDRPLTVVYQPHQGSRTKRLFKEFSRAFDAAAPEHLILAPIYRVAGREDAPDVTSGQLAEAVRAKAPAGMTVTAPETEQELELAVREVVRRDGIVVCMGAGSIRTLFDSWRTHG